MSTPSRTTVSSVAVVVLFLAAAPMAGAARALPAAVREAVRQAFPTATIRGFGRETENGVCYYEVDLVRNGQRIEVEVDAEGGIGEIERRITLEEAPRELAEAVTKAIRNGGSARIERHERWGVARDGRFVKLDKPRVFYEVKLDIGKLKSAARWRPPREVGVPEGIVAAIKAAFPRAVITEIEEENEEGVTVYEAAIIQDGQDMEVKVSRDGALIEVESAIAVKDVPPAALAAIRKAAGTGTIAKVERVEIRAEAKGRSFVALDRPVVVYEAELRKGDLEAEVQVAADGKVLRAARWQKGDDKDNDDNEDDD